MSLNKLLAELSNRRIQLWVDDDQLRIRAPKGTLSLELRNSLAERKQELIKLLRQHDSASATSLPAIVAAPDQRHQPFPLTDIQQAYWVGRSGAVELSIPAHFYCEIEFCHLDIERLSVAWRQLVARHEMLRVIVLPTGEQQILAEVPPYEIKVLDLRGHETAAIAAQLQAVRNQMSHQVRPTDQWPLFKIQGSCLTEQKVLLHFSHEILIFDGLSSQILMEEWAELYQNLEASLPPLVLSFRDYVLAKVALEDSPKFQQSWEYWQNRIPTLPPAPELPLAKQPTSLTAHQFAHLNAQLDPKTWLRLKNRATQAGITPTLALCAAYAEVLATWSKNPRFTLTILYLNRLPLHAQVNKIVGNFSTTVLLEVDNSGRDSFAVRAKRLQKQLWNDLEHSLVSGVQVVRELNRRQGDRPRATMPVTFASLISNSSAVDGETSPEQPQLNRVDSSQPSPLTFWENQVYSCLQVPQVFLDHQVWEANGALVVNWDFAKELFPEGLVEDMFDAYVCFLHRLGSEEEAWQERSPQLLLPAQLQQQGSLNATGTLVEEKLLHTLFLEQVSQRPAQAAVVSSTCTLTYQDLYRRSHQLGNQLRKLGIRPNQLVAVVMAKGWEQVVGVLSILMAGAAYVPIDPELPEERRWQLLAQSEVRLVLTQSWLAETLAWPESVQRICVDTADIVDTDTQPLEPMQCSEDLAYVIYTSGSTGLPKGVMIDHRGAVNTIVDINQRFGVGSDDRVLALSSLSFDLSVYDIFGTLTAGGTIVLPDASGTKEPAHWLALIQQQQVTIWNSVPALMQLLIEHTVPTQVLLSSLRLVLLSGDWIPFTLPSQLKTLVEGVQVVSLGGATEASIWSILYPIETVNPAWKSIPYGRPMVNQRFYVLNEALESRPVWVPGHLYIGGVGLAKGYWNNDEKTRASFIIHPRTGERLYRTGDLGHYLPDGNIEFLGREDFQLKVQGHRIECGEIEATLLQHPAVKAVVVTAVGEQQAAKRLVAYVLPSYEPGPTPSELQDFLAQKLPQYMVPSTFMMLPELPLTPNGKVDRRSLPIPDTSGFAQRASMVLPRDTLEQQLAQIWSEVLNVHPVGVRDNFFDLGGYSFAAMRLMARIQQQFGKNLPLSTLFQGATIEHLARLLRQQTDPQTSSPLVAIQPAGNQPPFFCIHPVGGNVLCYVDLARYLGSEQPFYGLQSAGLNGEQAPLTRIEDMAVRYIEALQTIQPQGPYQLGGWSLGGIVAFEMAQQLYQQGHEVALLALIDSYAPTAINRSEEIDDAMLVASVAQDLGGLFGKELPISVDELQQLEPEEQLNHILEQAQLLNILPPEVGLQQMHQLLQVFKANNQAMYSYIPQPYPSRIALLCASEQPVEVTQAAGWGELATGGIEVYEIPGDHYAIVREPQVLLLAEHLGTCLSKAREIAKTTNQLVS